MAGIQPAYLTFEEFYAEPADILFGTADGDIAFGLMGVNSAWRLSGRPPNDKEVHLKILAEFSAPV
jgi:hypothetical protein